MNSNRFAKQKKYIAQLGNKAPSVFGWSIAILMFFAGVVLLIAGHIDENSQIPKSEIVTIMAKVNEVYINGFGGDPMIRYTFEVNGRSFTNEGNWRLLDGTGPLDHQKGDQISVQYDKSNPTKSCPCELENEPVNFGPRDWRDAWLLVPLLVLIVLTRTNLKMGKDGTSST